MMYVFVKRGKLNVTAVLYVLKAAIWIWRLDAMYKQSMNVVKGVGLGMPQALPWLPFRPR